MSLDKDQARNDGEIAGVVVDILLEQKRDITNSIAQLAAKRDEAFLCINLVLQTVWSAQCSTEPIYSPSG